jgi:hypothetical protein
MTPTDEITLTLPRERNFYGIAHLVLAGLAARLDCTVEHLDDLQLALDTLLDHRDEEGEVRISLRVRDDSIEAEVAPLSGELRAELEREPGAEMDTRRVLDTVVDGVDLGADSVTLRKTVRRLAQGAS